MTYVYTHIHVETITAPNTPKLANMLEGGKTPILPPAELDVLLSLACTHRIFSFSFMLLSWSHSVTILSLSHCFCIWLWFLSSKMVCKVAYLFLCTHFLVYFCWCICFHHVVERPNNNSVCVEVREGGGQWEGVHREWAIRSLRDICEMTCSCAKWFVRTWHILFTLDITHSEKWLQDRGV